MSKPHYIVRRSRSGRFNFTLLSSHGRVTGVVMVQTAGMSKDEIDLAAHEKVRNLIADLVLASAFGMSVVSSDVQDLDAASLSDVEDVQIDAAAA